MALSGQDLYEQHAQAVYRYLFSLSREADTAEELTQETFCVALRSLQDFRGDSTPQVWLCGIAKRLWYKELERRSRTVAVEEDTLQQLPAGDNTAAEVEQWDDKVRLYRAMQKLDGQTREVIYLRLTGGFSFRDIGDILGKSEVWARVRFYRGKEQLTKLMGGAEHE